jgi:hypothetical protein
MRSITRFTLSLVLASSAAGARPAGRPAAVSAAAPRIEVLFALDTTGSMGGLLEGAKLKIWSIANQMLQARPAPRLRIGLLGYRDRGDAYVTRFTDLTDDLDAVYAQLCQFQADGGGDSPESVNQALHEAVARPSWSQDARVLKMVFLVGDAPPHMDYPDDVKFQVSCGLARQRDLVVNTVQCGSMAATTPYWQEIAKQAGGTYAALGQSGGMQAVATPMDAELAKLNAEVGRTIVAYGPESERKAVKAKQARAEAVADAAPSAAADRLAFNAATGKVVQGGGDLLDGLKEGTVSLEKLDAKALPEELRELDAAGRKAFVQKKEAERARIQARIADLGRQRQAFLEADAKKRAAAGAADSFDGKVAEAIRAQGARKGIRYGKTAK